MRLGCAVFWDHVSIVSIATKRDSRHGKVKYEHLRNVIITFSLIVHPDLLDNSTEMTAKILHKDWTYTNRQRPAPSVISQKLEVTQAITQALHLHTFLFSFFSFVVIVILVNWPFENIPAYLDES